MEHSNYSPVHNNLWLEKDYAACAYPLPLQYTDDGISGKQEFCIAEESHIRLVCYRSDQRSGTTQPSILLTLLCITGNPYL